MNTFEKIVIPPSANIQPKASVIWLHGLGADGHDFASIVPQLHLPDKLAVRFIFPHAPIRPVTLNAGMEMRAWFDLYGLGATHKHDEAGIALANEQLLVLIDEERAQDIPANKIVIAGFSQGGALALYTGILYPEKLAGIMALSTYLPIPEHLEDYHLPALNVNTPIYMAHGNMDTVIAMELGEMSRDRLVKLGFSVEWHSYHMMHSVCAEEIHDIAYWLSRVLE